MSDIRDIWSKSRSELEKSELELNNILEIVRKDTEVNDHIEKVINESLSNVIYKKKFFSEEPDDNIINTPNLTLPLQIFSGSAIYTTANLVKTRKEFEENLSKKTELYLKHKYRIYPSTGDYEFNDIVTKVNELSYNPQLKKFYPVSNYQWSRTEIFNKLLIELKKFDMDFVRLLDNSEENIITKPNGWMDNSINSTVELIDRFLRQNAPNNQIKIQFWFTPDKSTENGITRNHRVYFYLLRKTNNKYEEIESDIKYWGDEIKYSVKKLQKFKHTKKSSDLEISIMDKIDYARLVLLNIILY